MANRPHTRQTAIAIAALIAACNLRDPDEPGNLVPRTVVEDPELPGIDLAGSRFHLETYGSASAQPIVFLHGGPGGDYRGLLRLRDLADGARLEDDHYLIFWDQRGAGLSKRHDADGIDVDRYIADLDAVIDEVAGGRPVVLVGHSWGGMFAAAYLDRRPERVRAAVLLEPGPLTGAIYEELADQIVHIDLTAEWINDALWSQRFLGAADHARLDYAPLVAGSAPQPAYHLSESDPLPIWRFGTIAQVALQTSAYRDGRLAFDFTTHTRDFTGPIHLVASADNEVLGLAFQSRQASFFTAPQISVVDGGHDFPWTHPVATIATIRATLSEVAP